MWPFGETDYDKYLRNKDERMQKAKSLLPKDTDTFLFYLNSDSPQVIYKNKNGDVKAMDYV